VNLLTMQSTPFFCYFPHLDPNVLLSTLYSETTRIVLALMRETVPYTHIYAHVGLVYVCVCVCVCVYIYIYIYMCVYIYIYIYMCVCVKIYPYRPITKCKRGEISGYEISGFHREVDEKCTLLGYYATCSGNYLSTFRNKRSVPYLRRMKMEPIVCPKTSARKYHYTLRNSPEERRYLVRGC
jgi:hypothetical protein